MYVSNVKISKKNLVRVTTIDSQLYNYTTNIVCDCQGQVRNPNNFIVVKVDLFWTHANVLLCSFSFYFFKKTGIALQ